MPIVGRDCAVYRSFLALFQVSGGGECCGVLAEGTIIILDYRSFSCRPSCVFDVR